MTPNIDADQRHRSINLLLFFLAARRLAGLRVETASGHIMRFSLTSQQYRKIDAAAQVLPLSLRHSFLVKLAGKIVLNARVTRSSTLADALLTKMIDEILHDMRMATDQKQQPLSEDLRLDEDCVEVTAKELDILIGAYLRPSSRLKERSALSNERN
jgi:hypothetical protein